MLKLDPHDPQIAATILQQLGGMSRLNIMIGAKNFIDIGNGLKFKIGRNAERVNLIDITLNGLDLYDVRLMNFSMRRDPAEMVQTISEADGVYWDQLRGVIERGTGMALSL